MFPPFVNKILFVIVVVVVVVLCFLSNVVRFQVPQSVAWSWDKDMQYWF